MKKRQKLLFVSNRLPVSVERRRGKYQFTPSVGGLATGLGSFYQEHDARWIGWSGLISEFLGRGEEKKIGSVLESDFRCHPVSLGRREIDGYYQGFCNKTIWPLFHCFTDFAVYDKALWETYKRANRVFADEILKIADPDDVIWVHDYQLMLLPEILRERLPGASIGFFLHIPFPSMEIFSQIPWRKEILKGLLGADLIGFHTYDYVYHFLDSVRRLLDHENAFGRILVGNRVVKADIFPMGIDYDRFAGARENPDVGKELDRLRKRTAGRKVILSVDRLDYTKGILHRLEAFDFFLEKNPSFREKVHLVLVAVPSRTRVDRYMHLKKQVDEQVGRINGKYGTIGWMPIWYLYRSLPFHSLAALYCLSDVNLVTPLRDGMNLIAKEYVAAKADGKGVLVLSEMAGVAQELGEAIVVNPNNKEKVAQTIRRALEMPEEEQKERLSVMQDRLKRYDVRKWARDFLSGLSQVKSIQEELCATIITPRKKERLIRDYEKARTRLIILDYDGTLIPFAERPEKSVPDGGLINLLKKLARPPENTVAVISGRVRNTLEKWFGELNLVLAAEHGAWLKERGGKWRMVESLRNDWKKEIRPVLEVYVDRTPGSFIEEKEYSLVWHYRKVSPELAMTRVGEIKDTLLHIASNLDLGVLEGSKIIEVKNIGINKGMAALRVLAKRKWQFILALGDDWTDEDVFLSLPESAYSVKVGLTPSKARFHLDSVAEVRSLLEELARRSHAKS